MDPKLEQALTSRAEKRKELDRYFAQRWDKLPTWMHTHLIHAQPIVDAYTQQKGAEYVQSLFDAYQGRGVLSDTERLIAIAHDAVIGGPVTLTKTN